MSEDICFLITILCGNVLLKCALKVKQETIGSDCDNYPMEPENRKILHALLPEHVKSTGTIIDIEEIFEIHDCTLNTEK